MATLPTNTATPNTTLETLPPPAALPAETKPSLWLGWLASVTHFKEGLLVVATLLFGLGYASVIYTAHRNNLGFIPPLQTQCVLAGIAPTLLFGVALLIFRGSMWLLERTVRWISEPDSKQQRTKRLLPFLCCLIATLIYVVFYDIPFLVISLVFHKVTSQGSFYRSLANIIVTYILGFSSCVYSMYSSTQMEEQYKELKDQIPIQQSVEHDDIVQANQRLEKSMGQMQMIVVGRKRFDIMQSRVSLALLPILLLGISLSFWLTVAYPNLPQEFDGMKPRFAYLDF